MNKRSDGITIFWQLLSYNDTPRLHRGHNQKWQIAAKHWNHLIFSAFLFLLQGNWKKYGRLWVICEWSQLWAIPLTVEWIMTAEAAIKDIPLTQNFIRTLHKTLLREDYTVYRNLTESVKTSYLYTQVNIKHAPIAQSQDREIYSSTLHRRKRPDLWLT